MSKKIYCAVVKFRGNPFLGRKFNHIYTCMVKV